MDKLNPISLALIIANNYANQVIPVIFEHFNFEKGSDNYADFLIDLIEDTPKCAYEAFVTDMTDSSCWRFERTTVIGNRHCFEDFMPDEVGEFNDALMQKYSSSEKECVFHTFSPTGPIDGIDDMYELHIVTNPECTEIIMWSLLTS